MHYEAWCDGASSPKEGKNGRAGAAFVIKSDQNHRIEYKRFLRGTVNRAEVLAILLALEWAYENLKEGDTLTINSDSTFAVYAVAQKLDLAYLRHNVTAFFPELFADIVSYYKRCGGGSVVIFNWISRDFNVEADKLAKQAKLMGD